MITARSARAVTVATLASLLWAVVCPAQNGRLYLEEVPQAPRDSLQWLRLMFVPPANRTMVSFHVRLTWDPLATQTLRVDTHGGLQVANTNDAGTIALAGVETKGFAPGLLATFVMKRRRENVPVDYALFLREMNDPAGQSMTSAITVTGYSSPRGGADNKQNPGRVDDVLRLDSLTPNAGTVERDRVVEVAIHGRGFAATGNRVFLGRSVAAVVPSENNGTRIRFILPLTLRSEDGATERPVVSGAQSIHVENDKGRSNRLTFKVREGS